MSYATQLPPAPYQGDRMPLSIGKRARGSTQESSSQACSIPRVNMHFNVAFNQHDGKERLGRLHREFHRKNITM